MAGKDVSAHYQVGSAGRLPTSSIFSIDFNFFFADLRNDFKKVRSNKYKLLSICLRFKLKADGFREIFWRVSMQLKISGHHLQLTPAIENYLMRRLQKIERHHDPIVNGQVTLSVDKERQQAEGRIHFSGFDLFAQSTDRNLYAAIDAMADKLDRQVIEKKRKAISRRHR